MHRARKFAIFALVALLLPASAVGASLVWCVGLNGHNAIESAASSHHHETSRFSSQVRELCVEGGRCLNYDVLQLAEVPKKLASLASPSKNPTASAIISHNYFDGSESPLEVVRTWTGVVASQLAHLRTVVLLI
ncbi:hypothetical protein [Methyloceanibacter caenitepidi]|uniref:hypothetical protein n=1 Tax=Methyloceanibacter caenitepidi TaxID=1384459 RepID=UPI001ABAC0FD|nr:hypothetical protein [Methyloceanibacter caenitepidi]